MPVYSIAAPPNSNNLYQDYVPRYSNIPSSRISPIYNSPLYPRYNYWLLYKWTIQITMFNK